MCFILMALQIETTRYACLRGYAFTLSVGNVTNTCTGGWPLEQIFSNVQRKFAHPFM